MIAPTTVTPIDIMAKARAARTEGKTIVLTTGVFDLLHQEHQLFLAKAKQVGDFLVVAVESDARVKQIKGEGRPINSAAQRVAAIRQLQLADAIFILPDEFGQPALRQQLLIELVPDVLAVSSHSEHLDNKRASMAKIGGRVEIVHQHNPAVSTTVLLERGVDG